VPRQAGRHFAIYRFAVFLRSCPGLKLTLKIKKYMDVALAAIRTILVEFPDSTNEVPSPLKKMHFKINK
jgi:hypothetical protein